MSKAKKYNLCIEKIIFRLAELGLEEEEISAALDMSKTEFGKLKEKSEIKSALEKGLQTCTGKVERALYRRATGFEYEEVVNTSSDGPPSSKSETGGMKSKSGLRTTVKTVIPDVSACIFWLRNRLPDKWRDPKDIESNGKKSIQDLVEEYAAKGFEEDD